MDPVRRTPAVRLRAYRMSDLDDLTAGYGDPVTQRFMPLLPLPFTRDRAEWYLREGVATVLAAGGTLYAVADPATDRLLGGVGLDNVQAARGQAEIGYWVGPWARGRGVATAAVHALCDRAFAAGIGRLELLTHWDNAASQRVALATGFRSEGVRRGALPNRDGGRDDLLGFARLAGDPPGPAPRLLPDLPGGDLSDGAVRLRPLGPDDTGFYADLHAEPDVVATSVPPVAPDAGQVRRRCRRAAAHWLRGDRADLVIEDAGSGAAVGLISLFYQEPETGQAMIGYSVLPAWRGRGLATHAVQLMALWSFAETGIARLVAGVVPGNLASQRVLEKAGFTREAHLHSRLPGADGARIDDYQYVLLPQDLLGTGS